MKNKIMFKTLFLLLLALSFDLNAAKSNSCVGDNCQTNDLNFIDITEFNRREVFESLYERACKVATKKHALSSDLISRQLQESDFQAIESIFNWKIDQWKGCWMWIDLSQDKVDVRFYNVLYGDYAAQKALKPLKSQRALLS